MIYPRSIYSPASAKGWLPWGLAAPIIGLVLITAPLIVTSLWLERHHYLDRNGDPIGTHGLVALLSVPFLALGLVVLAWVLLIERRGLATIGLIKTAAVGGFLGGLSIGVVAVSLVVAMIWAAGGYRMIGPANALGDRAALIDIALLLACFALQSSVEEIVFRGWLLSVITRRLNLVFAVALSSIVFALLHFTPHQHWLVTANLLLFGLFTCCWAIAVNNVWGVMGWHAGWNWLLGTGFHVPVTGLNVGVPALLVSLSPVGTDLVTGGSQGPEGSLSCTLFFVAGIAFFLWRIRAAQLGAQSSPGLARDS